MPLRSILLSALLTIGLFAVISYTACKKDPCKDVICLNLGACDNGKCVCPTGFEGDRCEILSRDKLVKTFNGQDTCSYYDTLLTGAYFISFRAVPEDPMELTMKHFLNNWDDSAVCTMRAVDSFTFQGANNSTTFFGTGKVSNDSLWLVYRVQIDTSTYDCMYFGQGLR